MKIATRAVMGFKWPVGRKTYYSPVSDFDEFFLDKNMSLNFQKLNNNVITDHQNSGVMDFPLSGGIKFYSPRVP